MMSWAPMCLVAVCQGLKTIMAAKCTAANLERERAEAERLQQVAKQRISEALQARADVELQRAEVRTIQAVARIMQDQALSLLEEARQTRLRVDRAALEKG